MFDVQWKVFRKFCPLCYKQVIALSPRRIKDNVSLVFSKFSQIALVATRLGQFCENFENTRENLSLILLGLMRLHIQIGRHEVLLPINHIYRYNKIRERKRRKQTRDFKNLCKCNWSIRACTLTGIVQLLRHDEYIVQFHCPINAQIMAGDSQSDLRILL